MPTKPVKKTSIKKSTKKVVKPVVAEKNVATEIPTPVHYCTCTRRKKIMILACTFIAGFLVAQLFCFCGCNHHKRSHVQFVNGCVDTASVKCPKMLEMLPAMDANNDGCITKSELRAAKRAMRHHEKPVDAEPAVNVDEAIAPVME